MMTRLHLRLPGVARMRPWLGLGVVLACWCVLGVAAFAADTPFDAWYDVERWSTWLAVGCAAALSGWMTSLLHHDRIHDPPTRTLAWTRLLGVVATSSGALAAPAFAWFVLVASWDARTDDAVALDALCEPAAAAEEWENAAVTRRHRIGPWVTVWAEPRDGVCGPWDGSRDFVDLSGSSWDYESGRHLRWVHTLRTDEVLLHVAAHQLRGDVESSNIPSLSTWSVLLAAIGAAFGLISSSIPWVVRRGRLGPQRTTWYLWLAGNAVVGGTVWGALTVMSDHSIGVPVCALVCVLAAWRYLRRERHAPVLAFAWPLALAFLLLLPGVAVRGTVFVDPDVWRLPALGTLIAAFALTPLVAAVNERIRAMPD